MGFAVFLGFLIQKLISGSALNFKTLLPAITGGLVAGLVVYLVGGWLRNRKK